MGAKLNSQPSSYTLKIVNEKYPLAVSFIEKKEYQADGRVSVSMFQRKFRMGYSAAKLLMDKLIENKLVEPFEEWIGTTVNGERTSGKEITFYRVVKG